LFGGKEAMFVEFLWMIPSKEYATDVFAKPLPACKLHTPEVIMAGFKPGDTWCQQLLLDLNLVRRKRTTQAAAVPQAVCRFSVALYPLFNMAPLVQLP
jgi:hypothetical protein